MKVKRLTTFGMSIAVLSLVLSGNAMAHVVVKPAEVPTASFQTFTVSVPNEKELPTTTIKVSLPKGLKHVSPTVKPGWEITIDKEGEGEMATITALTWSGNAIPAGFRDDFTFSAQTPGKATSLEWKAYQTYEDGQVVAWDLSKDKQSKKADGSPDFSQSGPFSITAVTAKTPASEAAAAAENRKAADRALSLGTAGIILGLTGIFLATRKKN